MCDHASAREELVSVLGSEARPDQQLRQVWEGSVRSGEGTRKVGRGGGVV